MSMAMNVGGGEFFPFYSCFASSHSIERPFIPILRPIPSPWLLSVCLLELVPRPRAWDVRTGDRFAAAGGTAVLLVSYRIVPLSHCVRSLSSCLRFGFSSRASFFFLLAWSGLGAYRRGPFSLRPSHVLRPMRSLLRPCFRPRLIRLARSPRRPLLARLPSPRR